MNNAPEKGEMDISNIEVAEEGIAYNNFETAIVFELSGHELFRVEGKFGHVSFTSAQITQMQGMIVSHNHPYKSNDDGTVTLVSMSVDDLELAYSCCLHELRAVHGSSIHSFSWDVDADSDHVRSLCDRIKMYISKTKINMYKAKIQGFESVKRTHQKELGRLLTS